jgi:hypothetical protein
MVRRSGLAGDDEGEPLRRREGASRKELNIATSR